MLAMAMAAVTFSVRTSWPDVRSPSNSIAPEDISLYFLLSTLKKELSKTYRQPFDGNSKVWKGELCLTSRQN